MQAPTPLFIFLLKMSITHASTHPHPTLLDLWLLWLISRVKQRQMLG